jgi:hypothetical protein
MTNTKIEISRNGLSINEIFISKTALEIVVKKCKKMEFNKTKETVKGTVNKMFIGNDMIDIIWNDEEKKGEESTL